MERQASDAKTSVLTGLRILVVEDRGLIAGKIVRALEAAGCVLLGPAATLEAGFALLADAGDRPDAAVLDIDLRGELVYPLAEALQARGVPLLFVTGFAANAIPGGPYTASTSHSVTPRCSPVSEPRSPAGRRGRSRG